MAGSGFGFLGVVSVSHSPLVETDLNQIVMALFNLRILYGCSVDVAMVVSRDPQAGQEIGCRAW